MHTVGIDLAGENSPTGLCWITWSAPQATVLELNVGKRSNMDIFTKVDQWRNQDPETVFGIDAPFGFPLAFRDTVAGMGTGIPMAAGEKRWRKTEMLIMETKQPLSSVISLITNTVASRCYPLRQHLVGTRCTDLVGYTTRIFEVYPAVALMAWGISVNAGIGEPSYKRAGVAGAKERQRVLGALCANAPWLRIPDPKHATLLAAKDDAIDALVSAIVARVAAIKTKPTAPICLPPADMNLIQQEGWIHVPPPASLTQLPATPT